MKLPEKIKRLSANRGLAKKRVQCLNGVLYFVLSSVLADNLVLRNRLLRQAPKRYEQFKHTKNKQVCESQRADYPA